MLVKGDPGYLDVWWTYLNWQKHKVPNKQYPYQEIRFMNHITYAQ